MEFEKGFDYLFCVVGGEAVDDEDLAGLKRQKPLQAPLNVQLLVLGEDDNGNIGHNHNLLYTHLHSSTSF